MTQNGKDQPKIVDLAEARKRQKTVRIDAGGRRVKPQGASKGGAPVPKRKFWHYVQFVLFLAIMAYFMQLCSGRA